MINTSFIFFVLTFHTYAPYISNVAHDSLMKSRPLSLPKNIYIINPQYLCGIPEMTEMEIVLVISYGKIGF